MIFVLLFLQQTQHSALRIRIPGWALNAAIPSDLYTYESSMQNKPVITINGKETQFWNSAGLCCINPQLEKRRPGEADFANGCKEGALYW